MSSTSSDLENVEKDSAAAAKQWPGNWIESLGFTSDPTVPDPIVDNQTATGETPTTH